MAKPKLIQAREIFGILERQQSNLKNLYLGELAPGGKHPDRMSVVKEALEYSKRTRGACESYLKKIAKIAYCLDEGIDSRKARLLSDKTIECPVCYEDKKLVDTFKTSCNHEFCKDCLRTTLRMKINCPYCTQIIKSVTGDRLYYVEHVRGELHVIGTKRH